MVTGLELYFILQRDLKISHSDVRTKSSLDLDPLNFEYVAIEDEIAHNGSPVRKESNDMRNLEIEEGLGRQFTEDGKIPWRGVVL